MQQITLDLDLPCTKMSPERSAAGKARTSESSSKSLRKLKTQQYQYLDLRTESGVTQERLWETVSVSHGEHLTHNFGESPSVAVESTLSQILQAEVPEKYYLSKAAVTGILRRASRRGKELPKLLRHALEVQGEIRRNTYGEKEIANAGEVLRKLWGIIGSQTFGEWVRRTIVLVQQEKILFCKVCNIGNNEEIVNDTADKLQSGETTCKKDDSTCPMCYLRESGKNMGSPQGRESIEQLAGELGKIVHELSRQTAPEEIFMCCLRSACERTSSMYEALAGMEEIKSAGLGHPIHGNVESGFGAAGFDGYNAQLTGDVLSTLGINCGISTGRNGVIVSGIRSAGFKWGQGAQARSIGYSEEVSPTLPANAGGNTAPAIVSYVGKATLFEPRSQDGVPRIHENGISPTLNTSQGGQRQPCVAFSFDSLSSNSMKSSNPHSGCREVDVAKCLDTTDPNPSKNQGGVAVVQPQLYEAYQHHGWRKGETSGTLTVGQNNTVRGDTPLVTQPQTLKIRSGCDGGGKGALIQDNLSATLGCNNDQTLFVPKAWDGGDISPTLTANNAGGNQRMPDKDNFNCVVVADRPAVYAQDAYDKLTETEQSATLRAKGGNYGGGTENLCATNMTVRRLTPTECARLQGFPDEWGKLSTIAEMSDEDYQFWTECRKVKATIDGKKFQPKTKEQTIKWYNKLHTDSAEYKMWGNGIALPCASYVLSGIANEGAKTLGSLFDGSGGFPIAGLIHGIKPLYSCEVEPYPVAVTKARFNQIK